MRALALEHLHSNRWVSGDVLEERRIEVEPSVWTV